MGLELLSDFFVWLGIALLAIGGFTIAPVFGFSVLGVGSVAFGLAVARASAGPRPPQEPPPL